MAKYGFLKKRFLLAGMTVLAAYIAACAFLLIRQRYMIFSPSHITLETPTKFHLPYEEVWLPVINDSDTHQTLHGWFIPAEKGVSKIGTILYLHGTGANISDPSYLSDAQQLRKLGFSVFLFDYRGYGNSLGDFPSEASIYEDAQIALRYLKKHKRISLKSVYLFGVSLGGAVAIDLAVKEPNLAGVIVVSSFTSMKDEVLYQGYRMFPIEMLLNQKFDSISKIPSIKVPIFIVHSTSDTFTSASMSQKLYDAAPNPKQILLIPGFDHGGISKMIATSQFRDGMRKYLQKVIGKKHTSSQDS